MALLNHDGAIEKPEMITSDPGAAEILSVWLSSGGTNMVLAKPDTWSDLAAWGLLFADISRYLAYVHARSAHADLAQAIAIIKANFNTELDAATGPQRAECLEP